MPIEANLAQFIEFLLKKKELAGQIRLTIKLRPFELLKKAERALERVREACSSKDGDVFEDSVILFANYSRAAADAFTAALMIWLLEYIERTLDSLGISSIFYTRPEVEKLGLLLSDTSFRELRKIAILFGLREVDERLRDLEKKYESLRGHPCWRLRNALAHGWPYRVSIEDCSIIILGKTVKIDDMNEFMNSLNEYLEKGAELVNIIQVEKREGCAKHLKTQ